MFYFFYLRRLWGSGSNPRNFMFDFKVIIIIIIIIIVVAVVIIIIIIIIIIIHSTQG